MRRFPAPWTVDPVVDAIPKIFIHLSRTGVPLVTYPAFERDVLWIST